MCVCVFRKYLLIIYIYIYIYIYKQYIDVRCPTDEENQLGFDSNLKLITFLATLKRCDITKQSV